MIISSFYIAKKFYSDEISLGIELPNEVMGNFWGEYKGVEVFRYLIEIREVKSSFKGKLVFLSTSHQRKMEHIIKHDSRTIRYFTNPNDRGPKQPIYDFYLYQYKRIHNV